MISRDKANAVKSLLGTGMTSRQIARQTGVSRQTVERIERGDWDASYRRLEKNQAALVGDDDPVDYERVRELADLALRKKLARKRERIARGLPVECD